MGLVSDGDPLRLERNERAATASASPTAAYLILIVCVFISPTAAASFVADRGSSSAFFFSRTPCDESRGRRCSQYTSQQQQQHERQHDSIFIIVPILRAASLPICFATPPFAAFESFSPNATTCRGGGGEGGGAGGGVRVTAQQSSVGPDSSVIGVAVAIVCPLLRHEHDFRS